MNVMNACLNVRYISTWFGNLSGMLEGASGKYLHNLVCITYLLPPLVEIVLHKLPKSNGGGGPFLPHWFRHSCL